MGLALLAFLHFVSFFFKYLPSRRVILLKKSSTRACDQRGRHRWTCCFHFFAGLFLFFYVLAILLSICVLYSKMNRFYRIFFPKSSSLIKFCLQCTRLYANIPSAKIAPLPPPPPTMYGSQNQCSVFNDNESNFLVCSRVCRWLFSMEFQWSFLRCWWLCDFVVSLTGRRRFFFVSLSLSLSLSLCCLCHSVPASLLHSSVEPTNERGKKNKIK